jgi:hypothetical protein
MTESWSGPARALTVHLNEWEDSHREVAWIKQHSGKRLRIDPDRPNLPRRLRRWYRFAATYGMPENDPSHDGATNAAQERFDLDPQRQVDLALQFHAIEHEALSLGQTLYVSAPVIEEVSAIADAADPEPLFPTDMLAPAGFGVLERPITIVDLHPDTGEVHDELLLPLRAFAWRVSPQIMDPDTGEFGDGIRMIWYTDEAAYREVYGASLERLGMSIGTPDPVLYPPGDIWPVEFAPWKFGRSWQQRRVYDPDGPAAGAVPEGVGYQRRWLFALMRLCWQTYLITEPYRPRRPELRRMKHTALEDGYVKVLRMRRAEYAHPPTADGSSEVPEEYRNRLRYRLRTRGHWRRVHVKSLGPARLADGSMDPATHRLRWVDDYWRGPEDAPEVDSYDVTAVVR